MGDRLPPFIERQPQHQCPPLCAVCGRGDSEAERSMHHQIRALRAELADVRARLAELADEVQQLAGRRPHRAVGITTTIGGKTMDITLSVDVTGESVSAQFVDDKGDVTAQGPAGPDGTPATISYTSSDSTVASVDPASGALTFNAAGTATLTATAVDATNTPIAGFPTGSANLTLTPGAAAGLQVSVEGAPPVPAP